MNDVSILSEGKMNGWNVVSMNLQLESGKQKVACTESLWSIMLQS